MGKSLLLRLFFGFAIVITSIAISVEERVEDFEQFWQTYEDAYVFFDLKKEDHGVDWSALKDEFLERVRNSKSDLDLYAAVTEAQTLLRDGHCYNSSFAKIRETERIYFQRIGLKLVDGRKIAVSKVPEEGPFADAGIKVGDELLKFDGKTIRQLAKEARKYSAASSESQFWKVFSSQLYINNPLKGKPKAKSSQLVFRNSSGELIEVDADWNSVDPTGPQNEVTDGWIDDAKGVQLSEFDQKKIEGPLPIDVAVYEGDSYKISYIKIESWMKTEDPIEQFEEVFQAIADTDGLVLDLRGNGGGVGPWGVLFTNYLLEKDADQKSIKARLSKFMKIFSRETNLDEDDGSKQPNDSWFERKLSKTFFRAAYPQLDEPTLEQIFSEPEFMKAVLKKAFGLKVSVDELKKYFKDGQFQDFYVNLSLNDRLNKIKPYTNPVYVLTDGGCYSTTDICMTILAEFKRIRLIGTPNGAGSGSPIPFVLKNSGLQVYVPHARAFPPYGTMIEGRPLQPDLVLTQTKEDLIKGKDTVLTEAVRQLYEEIVPLTNTFSDGEFELPEAIEAYSTIKEQEIEWGVLQTPDWAINATLEHQKRSKLKLK
ncbi:MAG: S41 family peptidase [bacterium]|nr:S41 family peptidase [bacterium]